MGTSDSQKEFCPKVLLLSRHAFHVLLTFPPRLVYSSSTVLQQSSAAVVVSVTAYDGVSHIPPEPTFHARYLHSWNSAGARKVGVGIASPRAVRRRVVRPSHRLGCGAINRAWETDPGVCDVYMYRCIRYLVGWLVNQRQNSLQFTPFFSTSLTFCFLFFFGGYKGWVQSYRFLFTQNRTSCERVDASINTIQTCRLIVRRVSAHQYE